VADTEIANDVAEAPVAPAPDPAPEGERDTPERRPMSAAWLREELDHADNMTASMELAQSLRELGDVKRYDYRSGSLPPPMPMAEQAKQFVANGGAARWEGSAWSRLANGVDQPVPQTTDDGLDVPAAMAMGDTTPDWAKLAKSATEAPKAAAGTAVGETGTIIGGAGEYLSHYQASDPSNPQSVAIAADMRKIGRSLFGNVGKPMQEYATTFAADPEVADTFLVKTAAMGGGIVPYLVTAALGTAVAGPYGGIAFSSAAAGASAYGKTYEEAIANGADHLTAADAAGVSALTTAGLMAIPVGVWLNRLPALMRESMVRSAAELAIHGVVFTGVAEAQKFTDNLIARSYYDPARPLGQGIGHDILEEFLVGAFLPGTLAAGGKGLRAVRGRVANHFAQPETPGELGRGLILDRPAASDAEAIADRAIAAAEQERGEMLSPKVHRIAHEIADIAEVDPPSAKYLVETMQREGAPEAADLAAVERHRQGAAEAGPMMAAFKSSDPGRPINDVIDHVGDQLGILGGAAEAPQGGGKKALAPEQVQRNRILAIANEGGKRLLEDMGPEISDLAQQHEREIAKYAFPGADDPVAAGFTQWFKDYIARPEDAKAHAPGFTEAFGDLLDAHDPALLQSFEQLQQASVKRRDARAAGYREREITMHAAAGARRAAEGVRYFDESGAGHDGPSPPGGWGLPPIPPPSGGGGGGVPQPPVPPAPKLPLPKAVRAAMDTYIHTFQPELVSDAALRADPLFAKYKSASAHEKDVIVHQAEEQWQKWNQVPEAEQLAYMRRVELGHQQPTPALREDAFRHRKMLDAAYREEAQYGSQSQYLEEYFPHLWKDPAKVREFFKTQTAVYGPRWFQKQRSFDLIDQGIAAGFELKSTNPEELVTLRLMASVDMRQRVELLHELEQMGMGRRLGDERQPDVAQDANAVQPLTTAEAASLPNAGWRQLTAPNGEKWLIAPDVQPLWKNAVDAKGLWSNEGKLGTTFRGWMAVKNIYVPLKLALSAFHPLHVAHIQMADGLARGWTEHYRGGDVVAALKSAAEGWSPVGAVVGGAVGSLAGPVGTAFGAYAGGMVRGARMGQIIGLRGKTAGMDAREAWLKPESERTPTENEIVHRMQEGGFVPQLSEQLKISGGRSLQEAMAKGEWLKVLPLGLRRGIEKLQAPIFEKWIPTVKAASYLQETAALIKRRPDLLDNNEQRRIAYRAIAKGVDDRFGEMFYGGVFWTRTVKDAGIASFLSLGWNLGFSRTFGGAAMETVTRRIYRGTESRQTIRDATNKGAFALVYGATAAMGLGMMSWMLSGEPPEGYDFIFPRLGGRNPDGSLRRVSQMTYLREGPMLKKHAEDAGSYPWGAAEMAYNKMLIEPFIEFARNRDYWGYQIWSEDAPLYKQAWQFMKHVTGTQLNPITVGGAARAAELSGKPFTLGKDAHWYDPTTYDYRGMAESANAKGVGLSMLGLGPAPSYVERKPYENLINHYYTRFVEPLTKPEERREMDTMKRFVRNQVALANQRGDAEAAAEARRQGLAAGLKGREMRLFHTPYALYQFSKLPDNAQATVLGQIPQGTDDEKRIYSMYRSKAKSGALGWWKH
jgi:hypothetical protein